LRREAEEWLWARLDGGKQRQIEPMLARARNLCRAVDLAWDGLVRVMAVAQTWARTTAAEALAAGLIAARTDVQFLEFEELKQIATGEWHRGRSEQVREEVMRRQAEWAAYPAQLPQAPCPASPGEAWGPLFRVEPAQGIAPPAGAVLLADVADPGCAPYWLTAAAVIDGAGDPWTPGMIVARSLGVPAVSGMPSAIWQAHDGQVVTVDGSAGQVAIRR
jgi:pyruvate,water dikinase